jgi:ABC-type oligopeptide transport system ATPase subunit
MLYSHIQNMDPIRKQVQHPDTNNTPDDDPVRVETGCVLRFRCK